MWQFPVLIKVLANGLLPKTGELKNAKNSLYRKFPMQNELHRSS